MWVAGKLNEVKLWYYSISSLPTACTLPLQEDEHQRYITLGDVDMYSGEKVRLGDGGNKYFSNS